MGTTDKPLALSLEPSSDLFRIVPRQKKAGAQNENFRFGINILSFRKT